MSQTEVSITVRKAAADVGVLDIKGEITDSAEGSLMDAYEQANGSGAQTIALNLAALESIDSFGIGLLIRLLADVLRRKQRPAAYGLSDLHQQIFELTQLDKVFELYVDEADLVRSIAG
jgi:anti-anti-sigma factor